MAKLPELTEDAYLEIEEALSSNVRGRAFLRMRDQRTRVIGSDEVRRLIRNLRDSVSKSSNPQNQSGMHVRFLRQELQEMSFYIQQTRAEIAALRPEEAENNRIMSATEELDAIVTSTERATNDILKAAERISDTLMKVDRSGEFGLIANDVDNQAIEIMTACSFQDITGQRITKVINAMRYIEQRVNSMVEIWGVEPSAQLVGSESGDKRQDAHLLNGPQKEGAGVSQSNVDALLAGLEMPAAAAAPAAASPPPSPPPPPPPAAAVVEEPSDGGAAFSQDDIDALFD